MLVINSKGVEKCQDLISPIRREPLAPNVVAPIPLLILNIKGARRHPVAHLLGKAKCHLNLIPGHLKCPVLDVTTASHDLQHTCGARTAAINGRFEIRPVKNYISIPPSTLIT
jgi:hypothetical protein